MEKKSLKSIVIGYKLSGLSYSDIATELEKEYGIKALAKTIGISRETVYKYIRVYNGEEVNGKSKNKV